LVRRNPGVRLRPDETLSMRVVRVTAEHRRESVNYLQTNHGRVIRVRDRPT